MLGGSRSLAEDERISCEGGSGAVKRVAAWEKEDLGGAERGKSCPDRVLLRRIQVW